MHASLQLCEIAPTTNCCDSHAPSVGSAVGAIEGAMDGAPVGAFEQQSASTSPCPT